MVINGFYCFATRTQPADEETTLLRAIFPLPHYYNVTATESADYPSAKIPNKRNRNSVVTTNQLNILTTEQIQVTPQCRYTLDM